MGIVSILEAVRRDQVIVAIEILGQYMDVVTSSGPGTGKSAEPERIKIMSKTAKKYNK